MGSDEMLKWLDAQDQKRKAETRRSINKFLGIDRVSSEEDILKAGRVIETCRRLTMVIEDVEEEEEATIALGNVLAKMILKRSTKVDELQSKYHAFIETLGDNIEVNLKAWSQALNAAKGEKADEH